MLKKQLEQRRLMRRKMAYHQGGSEGVEPNTYKSETFDRNKDNPLIERVSGFKDSIFKLSKPFSFKSLAKKV